MIVTGVCNSFKQELFTATHALNSDVIKCALYSPLANLSKNTTAYSSTDELVDPGYSIGGAVVAVSSIVLDGSGKAIVNITPPSWNLSSSNSIGGMLFYNSSKSNRAIEVINFSASAHGVFTFPTWFSFLFKIRFESRDNLILCDSWKIELLQGTHYMGLNGELAGGAVDDLYLALYDDSATFDPSTTLYSPTNEVADSGIGCPGYQTLGAYLQSNGFLCRNSGFIGDTFFWSPDNEAARFGSAFTNVYCRNWSGPVDITARWALLYNHSKGNRAIAIIDFLGNVSTYGKRFPMDVMFPPNGFISLT